MKLVLAEKEELNLVSALYESVKNTKFCVWDSEYPTIKNIKYDFKHKCLYVLKDDNKIVGAISVNHKNEFNKLKDVWLYTKDPCEIARVVVDPNCQNKGLGEFMINEICNILSEKGKFCIHLAVEENNLPAIRIYDKCGFLQGPICYMFEHNYYLYEKKL